MTSSCDTTREKYYEPALMWECVGVPEEIYDSELVFEEYGDAWVSPLRG